MKKLYMQMTSEINENVIFMWRSTQNLNESHNVYKKIFKILAGFTVILIYFLTLVHFSWLPTKVGMDTWK